MSGQKQANKPIPTVRDREIKREETGKAKETKGEGGGLLGGERDPPSIMETELGSRIVRETPA